MGLTYPNHPLPWRKCGAAKTRGFANMIGTRNNCHHLSILLLGLYWFALFVGTHVPQPLVDLHLANDKALHFAAFAGLAFLLAWSQNSFRPAWSTVLVMLIIVSVYGAVDELTQALVPGRTTDIKDWIADVAGAITGLAAFGVSVMLLNGIRNLARMVWLRGSSAAASK